MADDYAKAQWWLQLAGWVLIIGGSSLLLLIIALAVAS